MLDEHLHAFAKVFEFRLKFQWPDNNQIIMRIEHRGGGSVDASVPVWWNLLVQLVIVFCDLTWVSSSPDGENTR